MKKPFKHCLAQYLNSNPSISRKAVRFKRSYDEVRQIVQKLGTPKKKPHP